MLIYSKLHSKSFDFLYKLINQPGNTINLWLKNSNRPQYVCLRVGQFYACRDSRSVVWSPYTSRNIDKLERIQRRGTKFILGQNDISYEDRLKCLNMLSLEKRRYLFDVVFLYKVLNGYLNIELTPLLNFYSKADPYKFRHVDDYSLKRNYARTTKFKNSYFNRIVEMWNSLPLEIRLAPNLEVFKSKLKKFII